MVFCVLSNTWNIYIIYVICYISSYSVYCILYWINSTIEYIPSILRAYMSVFLHAGYIVAIEFGIAASMCICTIFTWGYCSPISLWHHVHPFIQPFAGINMFVRESACVWGSLVFWFSGFCLTASSHQQVVHTCTINW